MLSVTIATYNRAHLLSKVLKALAEQSLTADCFEIIICDSHSQDETKLVVDTFISNYPEIKTRHLHTRNVLAAKRNLGIQSAEGDIVIFFDDDCIPNESCLKTYFEAFEDCKDEKVVYCGEVRFPAEWVKRSNYYRFRDSRHFGDGHRKDIVGLDFKTIVVMNMAFRKSEFIEYVGEVNENFIGYGCEDQDLGWRLEKAGFSLKKSSAKILHHEESGTIDGYAKKIFHTARDGSATLLKHNKPAFEAINTLKLIDKEYPFKNHLEKFLFGVIRTCCFHKVIGSLFSKILTKNDRDSFFYMPKVFRYVLACAYIKGVEARGVIKEDNGSWYD